MTLAATPEAETVTGQESVTSRRVNIFRDYGIAVSFLALFIVLSVSSDAFLTKTNLLNILEQWAPVGIIACGGTLVLIAGGFDLSVAAVAALSGVIAAKVAQVYGVAPALVLGALTGLLVGVFNGLLATVGRVNAFIATLATSIMFRGIAAAITGGALISVETPAYSKLGLERFLGINISVYLFAAVVVLSSLALTRTRFGRHVYATGGNQVAARLSGIRVNVVRTATFAISGLCAGLAGLIISSRVSTGQADAAQGVELQAIAAIVIGGTSILGGEGAVWRTVLGVGLFAMINNGFNLLNVNPTYQQVFTGAIIIIAVMGDAWIRRTDGR